MLYMTDAAKSAAAIAAHTTATTEEVMRETKNSDADRMR